MAEHEKDPVSATPDRLPNKRALVLGGGGSAGNAWEIGVVAGLFEAGVDLTVADLIVGTSAGATAAAQITSTTPRELMAAIVAVPPPSRAVRPDAARVAGRSVDDHMDRTSRIIAAAADPPDMRRRMGAASLELLAATDGSWHTRWREIVAARLPSQSWPERPVLITAVDARSGEPVVFDRHSGVDLADAIAASTSASLPYCVGEDRYIDGGYRRNENADLAAGYDRVLVLSPFGGRSRHPAEWGMQLATQIEELCAGGSSVETVFPDAAARDAFGANMMDPSTRPPAARAGYDHGSALAERLGRFWR